MWKVPYSNTQVTAELGEIIKSGVNIWDFEYDSYYQGAEKEAFEKKVIDHYFFRQIGQETVGRFKHFFRTRVQEIMPYYKQLYESVDLMKNVGDPFEAYNLTETFKKTTSGTGTVNASDSSESTETGSESRSSNGKNRFSDTPQGNIENLDDYLTNVTLNDETASGSSERTLNGSNSSESTSESSGTEDYTLTRRGNIGVQPLGQEMEYYRKALINVDLMIIEELNDLFLMVY